MLRNFSAILFFLILQATLFSQSNTLLWKIESPQLSKPSYLYGTMHSRDKRAHLFGDSVLAKLNQCDAVALEILTSKMAQDPFSMLSYVVMKDTTLDMLLNEEDYQLVKNYAAEKLGMYALLIDKVMPIFVAGLITEMMMGDDMETTVDEFFERTAIKSGKKTIGIETIEEQLSALSRISLKEQAEMLAEQLRTMDEDSVTFEKLMDCYKQQELQCLQNIYTTEEISKTFDEALVTARNHVMQHRIDSLILLQPTFIAVGALHLAGENGLLELLKKSGHIVTPIFSKYNGNLEKE